MAFNANCLMSKDKQQKGKLGEDIAADFLDACGYQILERNWRFTHSEVDLIARIANTIVIVEVKTRLGSWKESPEDLLPENKRTALVRAGEAFIAEWPEADIELRFDLLIVRPDDETQVKHIPFAFIPGLE